MRVSSFWPIPRDVYEPIEDVTTDDDARRYDTHGHPIVTIAATLVGEVGFETNVEALVPGTRTLRVLHEIQVDERLPARTWHAGPRRPTEGT